MGMQLQKGAGGGDHRCDRKQGIEGPTASMRAIFAPAKTAHCLLVAMPPNPFEQHHSGAGYAPFRRLWSMTVSLPVMLLFCFPRLFRLVNTEDDFDVFLVDQQLAHFLLSRAVIGVCSFLVSQQRGILSL